MSSKKSSRLRRILAAAFLAAAIACAPAVLAPTPAEAAVAGFNPGNIIDDGNFYNGNAMSTSEVQSFLNQRLATCLIGKPPYMPGALSPSGSGNIIANNCLKDYRQTTSSRPSDAYCSGYVGTPNESAAQIIVKVGQACGISQKVLLVMLEKEQSLLTDAWPVTRQYNYALGMNCPDSGPGNSANCDAASAGFGMQLYLGARQLKVYKGNPNSFNYKPFQNNTIQWHPNASCGTSQVYIENWATAALYIYTPYRPNQAALNAGWGTGDSCSSYGNRNFYLFYTSWFGDTHGTTYPVTGNIAVYWEANKSWLGMPTAAARTIASSGGGRLQDFNGGFVYEANGGVAVGITKTSQILKAYSAAGGIEGEWGWPIASSVNQGTSGDNVMKFQGGLVVEANNVGVFLIPKLLVPYWEGTGGFRGTLGAPTASAETFGKLVSQKFQKNSIVRLESGEVILFDQRFLDAWQKIGGTSSALGIPAGVAVDISANGGGQEYPMAGGKMYRSDFGVVAFPKGNMLDAYAQAGGPAGDWGWPTGKPICTPDATRCSATFANGVAVWTQKRGHLFTSFTPPASDHLVPGNGESVTGGGVQ